MEDFTFQINVMAISLAFIALILVIFILVIIFFILSFYFRFANKLDKVLSDVDAMSEKCSGLVDLVSDEVFRAKGKVDDIYNYVNIVSDKFIDIAGFVQNFRIPSFIKALLSIFSRNNNNFTRTSTKSGARRENKKSDDDNFDF